MQFKHLSSFWYLPQPSCPLLLIDVDEVDHHTALDHITLSLHANLREQKEIIVHKFRSKYESMHNQCGMLY